MGNRNRNGNLKGNTPTEFNSLFLRVIHVRISIMIHCTNIINLSLCFYKIP